jgi:hypothetical protein
MRHVVATRGAVRGRRLARAHVHVRRSEPRSERSCAVVGGTVEAARSRVGRGGAGGCRAGAVGMRERGRATQEQMWQMWGPA